MSTADAGLLLAAEVQGPARRERRFGFRIGGTGFLVPAGVASEIVQDPVIHRMPWQTPHIRGLLSHRGNVVPVFDLSALFHTVVRSETSTYLLILDSGERAGGVIVDTLPAMLACEADEHPDFSGLPSPLSDTVQGTRVAAGERWFELDHMALFSALARMHAA
jgi:chemotaxis signal transduction protein